MIETCWDGVGLWENLQRLDCFESALLCATQIQLGFHKPLIDRCPSRRPSLTSLLQLFSLKAMSNSSLDVLSAVHPLLCASRLCACHRPISRSHSVYLVCVFHHRHLWACVLWLFAVRRLLARKSIQSRLKLVVSVCISLSLSFFQPSCGLSFSQPL